jgi:hypothetical protein
MDLLHCGNKIINMRFVTDIDYVGDNDIRFNLSTGSNDFIHLTGNNAKAAYKELQDYFNNKGRKINPTLVKEGRCTYFGLDYVILDDEASDRNGSYLGCVIELRQDAKTVRRHIMNYDGNLRKAELHAIITFDNTKAIVYKILPKGTIL